MTGLDYLNDPDTAEALSLGYGVPPMHILAELWRLFWRFRRAGVPLPADRRILVIQGQSP